MTKLTIEIVDTHEVTKGARGEDWLARVAVDTSKLSADIVAKLAIHGLHQKIADAASGAKTEAEAQAAMEKALDALLEGNWTSRSAGEGVSELVRVQRSIMRKALKEALGAKSEAWAKFTGLSDAEQNEKLDANYAKNEKALSPAVEAEMKLREQRRKAKAAIEVKIDL